MNSSTHSFREHARTSPSGAYRWVACPGSIREESKFPDKSSAFANEGTAAHMLAERCLATGFDPERFANNTINVTLKKDPIGIGRNPDFKTVFPVDAQMVTNVTEFVTFVRSLKQPDDEVVVLLEQRFDLSFISPGMFGTADVTIFDPAKKELIVVDLKYGRGVIVEPKENMQLILYALGALRRFHNHEIETVTVTIHQPRAPHPSGPVRSWSTTPDALMEWGERLGEAAYATTLPDAALAAGKHCDFCRAAATCPALRKLALEDAVTDFGSRDDATPEMVAKWLGVVGTVETWCKRVREFAAAEAKSGRTPPGYKLVAKGASRKWKDEGQVAELLRLVLELEDDQIYQDRALRSPPMIEKIIGKSDFKTLLPMVSKKSSGMILVADDDPRQAAISAPEDDFDHLTPSS